MKRPARQPARRLFLSGAALPAAFFAVLAHPATAQPAPTARPQGGQVVAGTASISQTATATQIGQTSQRAALNWQSFDVGSAHTVTFNQPSASAIALNRVTGPNPSEIAGKVTANGQIVLVNQSGVTFFAGSQVDAQSVVVSAAGITNKNFINGQMTFDQPAKPNARVANGGTITVGQSGLAALVAPQVANSGTIRARVGHVILAGAMTHTLDLYGDGLLSIDITGPVNQAPVGADGKTVPVVTNTGDIHANGGTVLLTAAAVDGVVQNLVTSGGRISASSIGKKTGTIALRGTGGSILVEGVLSAKGNAAGEPGGKIEVVTNGDVTLATGSHVNASGHAGGGVVAIGTTLARAEGGPAVTPTQVARNVTVAKGAKIAANATENGNGGTVTVLSTDTTAHHGSIAARGGSGGGNGGSVQIAGGKTLTLDGAIDVSAPKGLPGNIVLSQ